MHVAITVDVVSVNLHNDVYNANISLCGVVICNTVAFVWQVSRAQLAFPGHDLPTQQHTSHHIRRLRRLPNPIGSCSTPDHNKQITTMNYCTKYVYCAARSPRVSRFLSGHFQEQKT